MDLKNSNLYFEIHRSLSPFYLMTIFKKLNLDHRIRELQMHWKQNMLQLNDEKWDGNQHIDNSCVDVSLWENWPVACFMRIYWQCIRGFHSISKRGGGIAQDTSKSHRESEKSLLRCTAGTSLPSLSKLEGPVWDGVGVQTPHWKNTQRGECLCWSVVSNGFWWNSSALLSELVECLKHWCMHKDCS